MPKGHQSRTEWSFPGWAATLASTVEYNDLGLPTSFSYPAEAGLPSTTLQYQYSRGYLTSIVSGGAWVVVGVSYNDAGGLRTWSSYPRVVTEMTPDVMGRPHLIRISGPAVPPVGGGGGGGSGGGGGGGGGGEDLCIRQACGTNYARIAPFVPSVARLIGQSTQTITYYDSGFYVYCIALTERRLRRRSFSRCLRRAGAKPRLGCGRSPR